MPPWQKLSRTKARDSHFLFLSPISDFKLQHALLHPFVSRFRVIVKNGFVDPDVLITVPLTMELRLGGALQAAQYKNDILCLFNTGNLFLSMFFSGFRVFFQFEPDQPGGHHNIFTPNGKRFVPPESVCLHSAFCQQLFLW